jgi:hypothetical protein
MSVTSTNVLALPLAAASVLTGNNEDWIDAFEYLTGDTPGQPLDLRGISFQLMVRRQPGLPEVIVWASTADNTIQIGATPNYNFLIINLPITLMNTKEAGSYVADMIASDELYQRRVMTIDLTVVEGITK